MAYREKLTTPNGSTKQRSVSHARKIDARRYGDEEAEKDVLAHWLNYGVPHEKGPVLVGPQHFRLPLHRIIAGLILAEDAGPAEIYKLVQLLITDPEIGRIFRGPGEAAAELMELLKRDVFEHRAAEYNRTLLEVWRSRKRRELIEKISRDEEAGDDTRESIEQLAQLSGETDGGAILPTVTAGEIMEMTFDDRDFIIENGYLFRGRVTSLLGQGGIGKSRLTLQLALACVLGKSCFPGLEGWRAPLPTGPWLFIQLENDNRRLQKDLRAMATGLLDEERTLAYQKLHFMDIDRFNDTLSVASDEACRRIAATVAEIQPDVVVVDPLRDVAIGNLNEDEKMSETCRQLWRLVRAGNTKRALILVHHAATGRAGIAKAVGFDRTSFGRNSKALLGFVRAQINVVPGHPDQNEILVIASGKANCMEEFAPFAVRLIPDSMSYEFDPDFDLDSWHEDLGGKKREPEVDEIDVLELLEAGQRLDKQEFLRMINEDLGVGKNRACRLVKELLDRGKLHSEKVKRIGTRPQEFVFRPGDYQDNREN